MACNGLLGGLVAITASCAFVAPAAAALVGVVAGLFVPSLVEALERRGRTDGPVGAIAVHGACGAWATLRGILCRDRGELVAQAIGVVTNAAVMFSVALLFFRVVDRLIGNRVDAEWTRRPRRPVSRAWKWGPTHTRGTRG